MDIFKLVYGRRYLEGEPGNEGSSGTGAPAAPDLGEFKTPEELLAAYKTLEETNKKHKYVYDHVQDFGMDNYADVVKNWDDFQKFRTAQPDPNAPPAPKAPPVGPADHNPQEFIQQLTANPTAVLQKIIAPMLESGQKETNEALAKISEQLGAVQQSSQTANTESQWTRWRQQNPELNEAEFKEYITKKQFNLDDVTSSYKLEMKGQSVVDQSAKDKAERVKAMNALTGYDGSGEVTQGELPPPKDADQAYAQAVAMIEAGHTFE